MEHEALGEALTTAAQVFLVGDATGLSLAADARGHCAARSAPQGPGTDGRGVAPALASLAAVVDDISVLRAPARQSR
jgi:hypothetical protein